MGGGDLIKDEKGDWVIGFARKIRNTTSFMAELWALRDGLQLCLQIHAHFVIIELDAKAIVDAFNSQTYSNTIVSSVMDDCRHIVTRIPQKSFRHIYKEANKCVDYLARLGTLLESDFIVFSNLLVDLSSILEADANGLYVNRLCLEPLFVV